jgi:hypothetical protein
VKRSTRWLLVAWCVWSALAIALSVAVGGLSRENVTRLCVIGFLVVQAPFARVLERARVGSPRVRFVLLATLLAAVVEGFHMTSMPVFPSLRVDLDTPVAEAARRYLVDLAFTVPAYLVIFNVLFEYVSRVQFSALEYAFIAALGQALGDGGLFFFVAAPPMVAFLPYPMTNYVACNLLPWFAIRAELSPPPRSAWVRWALVPALVATYFVNGALIKVAGRALGLSD